MGSSRTSSFMFLFDCGTDSVSSLCMVYLESIDWFCEDAVPGASASTEVVIYKFVRPTARGVLKSLAASLLPCWFFWSIIHPKWAFPGALGAPTPSRRCLAWHLTGHPWLPLGPLRPALGCPQVTDLPFSGSLVCFLLPSALPRRHLASPKVPPAPLGHPKYS